MSDQEEYCPKCKGLLTENDTESCPSCGWEFVFLCEYCDREVAADAVICPHCDAVLEEDDDEESENVCPDCGVLLTEDDIEACPSCGVEFAILCKHCDEEVDIDAAICPHCGGILSGKGEATAVSYKSRPVTAESEEEEEVYTGECPSCNEPLYIEDGFCSNCGTTFCTNCVHETDEDDEVCGNCGMELYFDCPLCDFELTAGTEFCANCNALFPQFCTHCQEPFPTGTTECPKCETAVNIIQRRSARIIHTILVEKMLVRMVACPECGKQYTPIDDGPCPRCNNLICANCQINLVDDELICPRCGFDNEKKQAAPQKSDGTICPSCQKEIEKGSDECPHCEQLLCPECGTAVSEEDDHCPACGVEFELLCPECETAVTASATHCPNCNLKF